MKKSRREGWIKQDAKPAKRKRRSRGERTHNFFFFLLQVELRVLHKSRHTINFHLRSSIFIALRSFIFIALRPSIFAAQRLF
ncbi:uncharacterized protein HKW66_Vig0245940 [Vigna angularis]|uniref:Uncharacterized protein n=1 Tax=Phaseolus angularis TaxID=3914 RepID=A0A8T0KB60_PHAAN|nr:uncharacterized protein HKW66_Vig0245940 [Vigna angularis]